MVRRAILDVSQPVQHWILSWREGEQPTRAQAAQAVTGRAMHLRSLNQV